MLTEKFFHPSIIIIIIIIILWWGGDRCSLSNLLYLILNCLTGNDESGSMVEGQTFTIGECSLYSIVKTRIEFTEGDTKYYNQKAQ